MREPRRVMIEQRENFGGICVHAASFILGVTGPSGKGLKVPERATCKIDRDVTMY